MPIIVPIIAGLAGSTVVRVVIGGVVTYVAGTEVVGYIDEKLGDKIDEVEAEFKEAGATIISETVEELGDLSLSFIRGVIPAIIDGAKAGYDAIREGFRGKEPETIAALTISVLVIIAALTLLHEVRTGPGGAGEYAANNRFE
tara:strand:+ start:240 stop:668 length:429 start_codon:yes stop_codon:yes gene_type:complete